MTTQQRIALVTALVSHYKLLDAHWHDATKVFGTHNNPLFEATWGVFDSYVASVSTLIGDEADWLNWFIYDNKCGRLAMQATAGTGAKAKKIRTVAQIVAVIEWRGKAK